MDFRLAVLSGCFLLLGYLLAPHEAVFHLTPAIQTYAWGKPGNTSAVAQLAQNSIQGFKVDQQEHYAELWMGTHVKGPCLIHGTEQTLGNWLAAHPEMVGKSVLEIFPKRGELPYLLKVLSVQKALSIQAHPNKAHAEALHSAHPDVYPDANHKPEMAVALTPFEALCGFRPKAEIEEFLWSALEFRTLIGNEPADHLRRAESDEATRDALRDCFKALMTTNRVTIEKQLTMLIERLQSRKQTGAALTAADQLVMRLHDDFPGDVGCFCVYFLNHVKLQPGEALFLEANLPHAYLSGDCIEIMACSDNVVRAGLTPKFIDVETLCGMLNYRCASAEETKFVGKCDEADKYLTVFNPPVPDFALQIVKVPELAGTPGGSLATYELPPVPSASIILVLDGVATTVPGSIPMVRGNVLFVGADAALSLRLGKNGIHLVRAYCDTRSAELVDFCCCSIPS